MKHRIEYLINELKMTNAKFAEEIDVPKSVISHILTGRNKPSLDFIIKILNKFSNINSDWLLFGKGNIYSSDSSTPKNLNQNIDLFNKIDKNTENKDIKQNNNIKNNESLQNINRFEKQISKIIVYYSDNTFDEFNK